MKELILKILYNLNYKVLMKNVILFESNPDYSDNCYYVFKECIRQNINNNYKLIWFCSHFDKKIDYPQYQNVKFVNRENKLIKVYYQLFAKYIIDCNYYIKKINKNQFRMHLTHGCPFKDLPNYWNSMGCVDVLNVESQEWESIYNNLFNQNQKNMITDITLFGLPRNDSFSNVDDHKKLFMEFNRKKTILWLPTYRQHKNPPKNTEDTFYMKDIYFPFGIPCIESTDELNILNKELMEKDTLLIIKPHPAQDLSMFNSMNFSNIRIIYDSDFEPFTNLYNYLPNVDALITDYSSVYFDFLYSDKPIGLAIPDLKSYEAHVKFIDNYNDFFIGERILCLNDLIKFINNVYNDKDIMKEKRKKIKDKYCHEKDGRASERVVNHFLNKIGDQMKSNTKGQC